MAENTEAEPSIEEILDSIRQIISDDDEEEAVPASVDSEPEEEVIELRDKVDEEPEPEPELIEVDMTESEMPPPPPRQASQPKPKPKPAPRREENFDSILTDIAETAAYEGFSELARR